MKARAIIEAEANIPLGINAKRDDGDEVEWRYDPVAKGYRFTKWWNDPHTRKREVLRDGAFMGATDKAEFIRQTAQQFQDAGWVVTMLEAESPKGFVQAVAPRRYEIASFSGDWVADKDGNVVHFTPDYSGIDKEDPTDQELMREFESIVRFDVGEHYRYWGDIPSGIDICDIGYWLEDGRYVPPEAQYRADIKSGSIRR